MHSQINYNLVKILINNKSYEFNFCLILIKPSHKIKIKNKIKQLFSKFKLLMLITMNCFNILFQIIKNVNMEWHIC